MPSPVLNERTLEKAPATWAPPDPNTAYHAPIDDGPISTWRPAMMTVNGTIGKTAVLFTLLLISAAAGWMNTDSPEIVERNGQLVYNYAIPALAWVGAIVGIGLVFLLMFKPHLAKFIAPAYALAQGFFVGSLSKMYETFFNGIVVQAAGATIAVFGVMLFLYRARIIKVTERFRTIVISATIGIMNTVQSGLKALKDSAIQQPGVVMAGTIIAAVPIVIALLLFQKALIRGLASGAVKG